MTARPWAQTLLIALSLGLAGCSCLVPEIDLAPEGGSVCLLGTPCPDGTCVLALGGDICCGFGGECDPCSWGGFECPDGTCASSSEACCAHGGSCDPGDDGPHRPPGATEGDTDASSGSDDGSSTDPTSGGSSDGPGTDATAGGSSTDATAGGSTDGDASTTTGDATTGASSSTG